MRQPATDLMHSLFEESSRYEFFQLARRLLLYPGRPRSTVDDEKPHVFFRASTSMAFPLGEVEELRDDRTHDLIEVVSPVFGLFGPAGTLPHCDLETVVGQTPDILLIEFLDFFHNRLFRLLFETWKKNRPDIGLEREWVRLVGPHAKPSSLRRGSDDNRFGGRLPITRDPFTRVQLAWAGFPLDGKQADVSALPASVYAALNAYFARPVRSGAAMEGILSVCVDAPVRLEQFSPRQLVQPPELRTRLGAPQGGGAFNQLGREAVLAPTVVDYQSRFELLVGPLNAQQFEDFSPWGSSGNRYHLLREVCRALVGTGLEYGLRLLVQPEVVNNTPTCLGGVRLGYNSWIGSREIFQVREDPYFNSRWEVQT